MEESGSAYLEKVMLDLRSEILGKLEVVHEDMMRAFRDMVTVEELKLDLDSDLRLLDYAVTTMDERADTLLHASEVSIFSGMAVTSLAVSLDNALLIALGLTSFVLSFTFMLLSTRARKEDQKECRKVAGEVYMKWYKKSSGPNDSIEER